MMTRKFSYTLWASGLVLGLTSGCHSLPTSVSPEPMLESKAEATLELPPAEKAKACLTVAEMMEKQHYIDEAIKQYEEARKADPSLVHVSRRLAILYDKKGEFTKADEEYRKCLARTPKDADLHNDQGYSYYMRGNWSEAEQHFRASVKLREDNKRAWINLGMALAQQDKRDEALNAFAKAVPESQARCNLAFILAARGERDAALAEYKQAVILAPELKLAHAAIRSLEPRGSQASDVLQLGKGEASGKNTPITARASSGTTTQD